MGYEKTLRFNTCMPQPHHIIKLLETISRSLRKGELYDKAFLKSAFPGLTSRTPLTSSGSPWLQGAILVLGAMPLLFQLVCCGQRILEAWGDSAVASELWHASDVPTALSQAALELRGRAGPLDCCWRWLHGWLSLACASLSSDLFKHMGHQSVWLPGGTTVHS